MSICAVSGGMYTGLPGRFHDLLRGLAEEHDREVSDLRTQLVHAQNQVVLGGAKRHSTVAPDSQSQHETAVSGFAAGSSESSIAPRRGANKDQLEVRSPACLRASLPAGRATDQGGTRLASSLARRLSPCRAATLPGFVRENGSSVRSASELPPVRDLKKEEPPTPDAPPPLMPISSGADQGNPMLVEPPALIECGSLPKSALRTPKSPTSSLVPQSTDSTAVRISQESIEEDEERGELWQSGSKSPSGLWLDPADAAPKKGSLLSASNKDWLSLSTLKALVPGMRGSAVSATEKAADHDSLLRATLSPRSSANNRVSFNLGDKSTASINYISTDALWSSLELSAVWKTEFSSEKPSVITGNSSGSLRRSPTGLRRGWVKDIDEENQGCSTRMLIATPSSARRLLWEIAGFSFLIYDMVMIPLQVYEPEETELMYAIGMCCTGFWTLDIFASFLVGYHTQGFIEMRLRLIAWRYIRSWFLLDVFIIGMDWTFFIISRSQRGTAGVLRLTKFSRGFRVLRLLRIAKFHVILSEMIQRIHSEYKRTMIGILKIVFFIIIVNHFIACGFYGLKFLRKEANPDKYWVAVNFEDSDGLGYRYWTSMHWSLTQFTPASMEVVPRNSLERFYTVSVMFVALITFSSFISSITNAMTRLRQINASQMEQESILHRYLSQHNISRPLVARILHLIQDRNLFHTNTKARAKEEDVQLFKTLPDSIKSEVRLEAFAPLLVVHPLFFEYGCLEVHGMRRLCRSAVAERTLIFHEELFGAGRSVTHMVFIREGVLLYNSMVEGVLQSHPARPGSWVCEAALWADVSELPHPFTAMTACEILTLHARDFGEIVRKYHESARFVAVYAKMFMEYIANNCNDCPWKALGWHNVELVRELVQRASDDTCTEEQGFKENKSKKRNSIGATIGAGLIGELTKEITHFSHILTKRSKTGAF